MPVPRARRRILVSLLTSFLLVVGLILAAPADAGTGADEQLFVQLINQTRAGAGLPPLRVHPELTGQARSWASSMANSDQLAHSSDISRGISAPWTVLGENVGVHGIQDVQQLYAAFVASPSHYANIVDSRYTYVGVGVVVTDGGKLWTTHRFMATAEAPSTTAPPTTAPPTTAAPTTRAPTTAAPTTRTPATSSPTSRPAAVPSTTAAPHSADGAGGQGSASTTSTSVGAVPGGGQDIDDADPDEQAPAAITDGTPETDDGGDGDGESDVEPVAAGPGRPDVEAVEQLLIDLIEAGI